MNSNIVHKYGTVPRIIVLFVTLVRWCHRTWK